MKNKDTHEVGNVIVKKRSGLPNWWAYYRDNSGRQRLPSLKTNNLKKALQRAKEINDALEGGTLVRGEEIKKKQRRNLCPSCRRIF